MYNDSVLEAVASATGVKFVSDEDMSKLCSYGTGGKGWVFYPDSVEKCRELIEALGSAGEEYFFLGAGSNVLVSDEGADRAVISTKNLKGISVRGKMVTACAGEKLSDVLFTALYNSLGGIEFLSGIPASVGGAVAMNAGCFGKSIGDYVGYVVAKSGIYSARDCEFGYRSSRFLTQNDGILSVAFDLDNIEYEQSDSKINYYLALRRNKQPRGRSAGSVFKNDGYFAGKVIEGCSLKGARAGKAFVSEKHANFIVAETGATSRDISRLIAQIKQTVYKKCGIRLTEEIQYLGKFDYEDKS